MAEGSLEGHSDDVVGRQQARIEELQAGGFEVLGVVHWQPGKLPLSQETFRFAGLLDVLTRQYGENNVATTPATPELAKRFGFDDDQFVDADPLTAVWGRKIVFATPRNKQHIRRLRRFRYDT